MASTPSNMIPLGTIAPDFNLPDVISEKNLSFKDVKGTNGTLVVFICNHCPYVIHILNKLVETINSYTPKGISTVAISSNNIEKYPEDSPEKMKELALQKQFNFPYLYDETQEIAKAYDAACTPDFYLFNGENKLVYRGQFDSSRPKNEEPVTGEDLKNAINALLEGKEISSFQRPSIGCNIKWKTA